MSKHGVAGAAAALAILAFGSGVSDLCLGADQAQKPPVSWSASSTVVHGAAGATLRVEVSAAIGEGWHLYSLTQTPPPDPTVIGVPDGQPFSLDGSVEAPTPQTGFDAAQGADTEYYTDEVTFRIPIKAKPGTAPGDYKVRATSRWQACNGSLCLRPQVATMDLPVQIATQKD